MVIIPIRIQLYLNLNLFCKIRFSRRLFRRDKSSELSRQCVKTTRGFITEVGITRTPRFLVTLRTAFGHLSRGNVCQSVSLINKALLSVIFQFAGDFFSDSTHYDALSLIYYAYMVIIHSVYSRTYIKWPPIKRPSSIKRPVIKVPKYL